MILAGAGQIGMAIARRMAFLIDGGATASYFYGPLQPK